jgi:hypothetical protein
MTVITQAVVQKRGDLRAFVESVLIPDTAVQAVISIGSIVIGVEVMEKRPLAFGHSPGRASGRWKSFGSGMLFSHVSCVV